MGLSSDLLSQFAKITQDNKKQKTETTVYGTVKEYNSKLYVQIDGSDLLTPTSTTADMKIGERVMVQIKDHSATIVGNITSPAARTEDVQNIKVDLEKVDTIKAENVIINQKLEATTADIEELKTNSLTVDKADIRYAAIDSLKTATADIEKLKTDKLDASTANSTYATIESLNSANAEIIDLKTIKLDASVADVKYATIESLNSANAEINDLKVNKLDAESANLKYANIDFSNINMASVETLFTKSGIINNLIVDDTRITGELVGVTIRGDLIEGNTIVAEKLVVQGEDGLYYKLNTDGIKVEAEQTDYNSLNGSIITTKSITATKIAVEDLVAFDATIGGFNITENSIYSGAKESATNTTRGIYLDKEGQLGVGDSTNFIKYYKDQNGNYKLEISADSMVLSSSSQNIETVLSEVSEATQTNSNDLANYISTTNAELENLQGQIDGSIATWFYEYIPTNSNIPASEWTTTDLKNNHLGDLFYDTLTGYCYRWQVQNNTYSWNRITDVDVTKALADAAAAQDTADNKRRVFVSTPTPPYDIGDLWVQGTSGDIMRCQTAKTTSQSYASADWIKASKYTDDTVANTAQADADALKERMSSAETTIAKNSEEILLKASKTEVTNTYATKTSLDTTNTNVTNAQNTADSAVTKANNAQASIDNLKIGGRNLIIQHSIAEKDARLSNILGSKTYRYVEGGYVTTDKIYVNPGATYTLSAQEEITGYLALGYFDEGDIYTSRPIMCLTFSEKYTKTITIPDGIIYCRISFMEADKDFIKFEKGNKVTDWTPAPEDVQNDMNLLKNRVTIAETTISQNVDAIVLKAEKTEVETAKAEAISTASSDATTKANNALTSANSNTTNLLKDYSTTSEMNAAIQLKADSITSSVSSTYTTKSETATIESRMSTVEQTATGLSVRLGTAEDNINNLSIGGRNLIIYSSSTMDYWINNSGVAQPTGGEYKSAITKYIDVTPSTEYILTRQESSASDGGYFRIAWYDENEEFISRAAYGDLETHITSPSNAKYIRIAYPYDAYSKFEKGNRATDWSPAPEDVDFNINALDTRVTDVQTIANTANTTAIDSAKTATNYLGFSSSGLVIGDMTASTLGENVLIDSNSVDIREGTTTLASFGASTIYLGKNSETSVINLCNGAATMRVKDNTDFRIYTDKRLVMSAYDSMLLDCWRDSTHMTRIAIQSSDPDDASMVGGVQFTIYQDTIQNTVQMLGNDIIHKVTDGTNETYTTMHESIYKVNTSGTIVLNSPSSVQIGDSSSYSFGLRLGSTYTKNKSINCYWIDGEIHDLLNQSSNGQTCYYGAADIDQVTNTNVRGKYVRLYAHSGGGVYLGASGSTAITSDRNMKKDIVDLDDKYIDFFDRLRPITYKYNDGHRDHIGFVAQEVEEALNASGLTTEQFAGLVIEKDVTLNPNYDSSLSDEENAANETRYETLYSLRYEEFISLLAKKVQNLQKQINEINANK